MTTRMCREMQFLTVTCGEIHVTLEDEATNPSRKGPLFCDSTKRRFWTALWMVSARLQFWDEIFRASKRQDFYGFLTSTLDFWRLTDTELSRQGLSPKVSASFVSSFGRSACKWNKPYSIGLSWRLKGFEFWADALSNSQNPFFQSCPNSPQMTVLLAMTLSTYP